MTTCRDSSAEKWNPGQPARVAEWHARTIAGPLRVSRFCSYRCDFTPIQIRLQCFCLASHLGHCPSALDCHAFSRCSLVTPSSRSILRRDFAPAAIFSFHPALAATVSFRPAGTRSSRRGHQQALSTPALPFYPSSHCHFMVQGTDDDQGK